MSCRFSGPMRRDSNSESVSNRRSATARRCWVRGAACCCLALSGTAALPDAIRCGPFGTVRRCPICVAVFSHCAVGSFFLFLCAFLYNVQIKSRGSLGWHSIGSADAQGRFWPTKWDLEVRHWHTAAPLSSQAAAHLSSLIFFCLVV